MSIFTIVVVLILIGVVFVLFQVKRLNATDGMPYEKKKFFFTPAERSFYDVLKRAVGDQYVIFGQVSVANLLRIQHGVDKGRRQGFFNKISAKHVDYVLCDPIHLTVVAAIELDGKSHKQLKRMEREAFLNQAFEAAELPLVRFKAQRTYNTDAVAKYLHVCLKDVAVKTASEQERASERKLRIADEDSAIIVELDLKPMDEAPALEQEEDQCPKCAAPMVLKKAEKGRRAGKYFLLCSTYPTCKRAVPVEESKFEEESFATAKIILG